MLSLVLLPVMSEAWAASAPSTDAPQGTMAAEPVREADLGFAYDAFAAGAIVDQGIVDGPVDDDMLGLEDEAVLDCLPCAVPAALPAAQPAHLPTPGLREVQVPWPEGLQQPTWGARHWPAAWSRGPPPEP